MNLNSDIKYLKGVGPILAGRLNKLGIFTVQDLFYFFPYRYQDRTKIQNVAQLSEYKDASILLKGVVAEINLTQPRPRFTIVKAIIEDAQAKIFTAVWFNQKFIKDVLRPGLPILIYGKVVLNNYSRHYEVQVEDYELIKDQAALAKIIPFYNLTEGVYQKKLRQLVRLAVSTLLPQLSDPLPFDLVVREKLMELKASISELHFPTERNRWKLAHNRIVFDEFFYVELGMAVRYFKSKKNIKGIVFQKKGALLEKYYQLLPYKLTGAQQRVIQEIFQDMCSDKPMNRMLQGDVGSGKTDVAVAAILCAVQSGYQAAIMVPTEVLAIQHYAKIESRLTQLGVRVLSLLGRHTAKEKNEIYKKIENNECDLVIGTQAIIQEKVKFAKLGFVIIDEQHRFGVVQRQLLKAKGVENLDLLVMTATPIPRTLALTIYGDLDKSIIDEMPPGRTPIKTYHVVPNERSRMHEFCRRELNKGYQVYIIYPLVEESEKIDLNAAVESYEYLKTNVFPEFQVGLLHGRMKDKEKTEIMDKFRDKQIQVLVSTTVIEVGIDVPNATIMAIENAERFGLAQLHQLRGRVGRGQAESYCFLIAELKSAESRRRIKAMTTTTDGFKLAEIDLELRGPGEFVGVRQSGFPEFILADFIKDEPILKQARALAFELTEKDNLLISEKNYLLKKELLKRSKGLLDYILLN